jgi:hypothetical protein
VADHVVFVFDKVLDSWSSGLPSKLPFDRQNPKTRTHLPEVLFLTSADDALTGYIITVIGEFSSKISCPSMLVDRGPSMW